MDENRCVEFYNGRNRFANIRDAGVKEMPFVIEKRDYKQFVFLLKKNQM